MSRNHNKIVSLLQLEMFKTKFWKQNFYNKKLGIDKLNKVQTRYRLSQQGSNFLKLFFSFKLVMQLVFRRKHIKLNWICFHLFEKLQTPRVRKPIIAKKVHPFKRYVIILKISRKLSDIINIYVKFNQLRFFLLKLTHFSD